ncbi:MAG: hypothetical protein ACI9EW_003182 [Cellvibrionaceae bacterium]|jgi:hypothetical protein
MKFSQRIGKTSVEKLVQYESIDEDLRNGLWNALTVAFLNEVTFISHRPSYTVNSSLYEMIECLWMYHFKIPVDQIPTFFADTTSVIRKEFFEAEWYEVFDFLEACIKCGSDSQEKVNSFIELCNFQLMRENSAYRFVNRELTEITSVEEIEEVEKAINQSGTYSGVKAHLSTALTLMNDRDNPDFRNSIKESISAVESLAKILSGDEKATLGQALKVIERNGVLHSALKSAFSSLYGYTNDANGIRHALHKKSTLTKAEARFMLVSCSSFVNYLIELNGQ